MATQTGFDIKVTDSGSIWRERIFWLAAGIMILWRSASLISLVEQLALCFIPAWQKFYIAGIFMGWPVLLIGFLIARGRYNRILDSFWFFQSRPRLIALLLLLTLPFYSLIAYDKNVFYFTGWHTWQFFTQWLTTLIFDAVPMFLLVWLLPSKNRMAAAPSRATMGPDFDLSPAFENWRNELAAQPQLTADDRRELERHLADSVAALCRQGLSEEEAFQQACQRIGSPQQLAKEFEKANPSKAWRERMFWAAIGIMVFWQAAYILRCVIGTLQELFVYFFHYEGRLYADYLILLADLVFLLMAIMLIKGRTWRAPALVWFFGSRFRLATLLVSLAILCSLGQQTLIRMSWIPMHQHLTQFHTWIGFSLLMSFKYLVLAAAPMILAIWFLPKRYRTMSRRVSG